MDLVTHGELSTRRLLAQRPTWMLLTMWEMTECQRDDATEPLLIEAAARLIDWTIDELDARYPAVLRCWHNRADTGIYSDLQEMYRDVYRQEVGNG